MVQTVVPRYSSATSVISPSSTPRSSAAVTNSCVVLALSPKSAVATKWYMLCMGSTASGSMKRASPAGPVGGVKSSRENPSRSRVWSSSSRLSSIMSLIHDWTEGSFQISAKPALSKPSCARCMLSAPRMKTVEGGAISAMVVCALVGVASPAAAMMASVGAAFLSLALRMCCILRWCAWGCVPGSLFSCGFGFCWLSRGPRAV